ncbi:phosphoglucan phosphatase LSF1, chloroplastic-like isoform X2 [Solanum pennellii]|uniref:Phosphoglucan phosphatase LSF1, chloroplastic-like isoform X2 n=1 Tax=Solanum pennellii TaxID=28526 RepID=A0ABM1FP86_SOLPN|nr:phosphoglucan phosphatase LSF1, chloroplastic-like isoform X2 [Solanum pennellii]
MVFNDTDYRLQKCVVFDGRFTASSAVKRRQYRPISVMSHSPFNMNLNEYMDVTLVKSLGIRQITEQIYVGSCIQKESHVEMLSDAGITAVVNFQTGVEAENWRNNANLINESHRRWQKVEVLSLRSQVQASHNAKRSPVFKWRRVEGRALYKKKIINESCQRFNILMINYPIREGDSFHMRKRLPFCVGLLLRLLKKNHKVYVTCTTGFDRSPACVVAYLHWMTDTSLHAAYNIVTGLHSCKPYRSAIAWATWDLIAMVENGAHDGPATHAVTFVWNGHKGEDVYLVGDFTGNWKEPIQAVHKVGPRFEAEVRLSPGKYLYKYIICGNWRHSTNSPTERDERGSLNNVIVVGDVASVRPLIPQQKKDANIMKVIERPLTENERFMLAKAARCVAFSICPIKLAPK